MSADSKLISLSTASNRKRLLERPRLSDVADLARVSTATVSRVLNKRGAVRPALQTRVRAAIEQLAYVPHGAARALATQRSYTIGAIVPTLDNAIFARGIQALQARLHDAGYTLLVASSDYDPVREWREAQSLIERGVDALMLVGESRNPEVYALLASKRVPYVNTWIYSAESAHPCIGFDNYAAAFRLGSYLLDLGHGELAMIAGVTAHNDRAAQRVAGVRAAMRARGLSLPAERVLEQRYEFAEARSALRTLLALEPRPTAVICGNDVLALGALFECQAHRIEVPHELSITGFDDLDLAAHVQPPLTTMRVPSVEMGERAAAYLLARLAGQAPLRATELEVSLIVRGTTAPPAAPSAPRALSR